MRPSQRRQRGLDSLTSPEAVRSMCILVGEEIPSTIPASEKRLSRLLFAVRYVERRPATDTRKG